MSPTRRRFFLEIQSSPSTSPRSLRDDSTPPRWLVAVKRQLQTGEPPNAIGKAVAKVEELLSYGGRDPTGW
jgi:hypothetical protein